MHGWTRLVLNNPITCLSHRAWSPTSLIAFYTSLGRILLPRACFSNTNQPIHSLHSQPVPLLGSQTPGHYPPTHITPGPGVRQLWTAPMSQSLLKLFKLTNPKHACFALSISLLGNHSKGSCPQFPRPSV